MSYDHGLRAFINRDRNRKVRDILHTQEYFLSEKSNARLAVTDYLHKMAGVFDIPEKHLKNLSEKVSFLEPRPQDIEYRLYEIKKFFSIATYCYYQTIHNVPVWHGGMSVSVKENPYRIIHAEHYGHRDLDLKLPARQVVEQRRDAMVRLNYLAQAPAAYRAAKGEGGAPEGQSFGDLFPAAPSRAARSKTRAEQPSGTEAGIITRALFYVYRYDEKERQPGMDMPNIDVREGASASEAGRGMPTLPLPPVPDTIQSGRHYLVTEVIFHFPHKPNLHWKALVEAETDAILWLRPMTSGVDGLVFPYDPKTATGDLTITPDKNDTVLDPLRVRKFLPGLNAPVAGVQSLTSTHVTVIDDDPPSVAPPTESAGTDFIDTDKYHARTNDFAAVNAYYHSNNLFDKIEDLGFTLADYFNTTAFPVHVDHRASFGVETGIEVNAFCNGDGPTGYTGDGIGLVGFCLSDTTDTTHPLGRAVDKWVPWHEIGGHGILWDHVNSANFGFAHSAGDSLAAFQNDPESQLRSKPERFQYAPFRTWPPGSERWFNRKVSDGWGWGGVNDDDQYKSEQILATTLFRIYQALGGDSDDVAKRWQASDIATYLVLNAVGHCHFGTYGDPPDNPATAEAFYNKLVLADRDDWTSRGWAGGAYNKVIHWSFEKQGLWRAAGAPTTDAGQPPEVDLYINDGRDGEYQYQAVHWENPSVWNRQSADATYGHLPGVPGVDNYTYVRVKNRGTTDASGTVKVYHCKPGAGLTWPTDFVQAEPLEGIPTGNVLASNGNEVTVGPFTWVPNVNMYGHDCLLAIVSAEGDPSNVDNLGPGETIQEWRLVPHDNNVGQRNVALTTGGEGAEAFTASLDGAVFLAGNNFNMPADMELKVQMPRILAAKGWGVQFTGLHGNRFRLKAGEKRQVELKLVRGTDFTAEEIRKIPDKNITVYLYGNGMILGGMSYSVDPDVAVGPLGKIPSGSRCTDAARNLLRCLKIAGDQKVRKVFVDRVSVSMDLEHDCR